MVRAELLAVGEELLAPGRVETNSLFLTEKLSELGIPIVFRAIVGDDEELLAEAMRQALTRSELVLVTGGLGPTADDRTRDAACRALGRTASLDPEILDGLKRRFARRGIEMPDVNRRQAMVLEGSEALRNSVGSAPGLFVDAGEGRAMVLLPGPPRELRPMFEMEVKPRLAPYAGADVYRVLKLWVAGMPESAVEQTISDAYRDLRNPETTILAGPGQVEIRLTARGASPEDAERLNEDLASVFRARLGSAIFTERETPLEEVVGRLLLDRGLRLSVAESLTGGLIAHRVTEVPGASRYFDEGFVTYSNESKSRLLGVPSELFESVGAVSEEVALAMAAGARDRAGSDLAVAATGIAGPSGGSETKPVGLVYLGLATPERVEARRHLFPGTRSYVKAWTGQVALDWVRLALLDREPS